MPATLGYKGQSIQIVHPDGSPVTAGEIKPGDTLEVDLTTGVARLVLIEACETDEGFTGEVR